MLLFLKPKYFGLILLYGYQAVVLAESGQEIQIALLDEDGTSDDENLGR